VEYSYCAGGDITACANQKVADGRYPLEERLDTTITMGTNYQAFRGGRKIQSLPTLIPTSDQKPGFFYARDIMKKNLSARDGISSFVRAELQFAIKYIFCMLNELSLKRTCKKYKPSDSCSCTYTGLPKTSKTTILSTISLPLSSIMLVTVFNILNGTPSQEYPKNGN
jgi:hypothetical protein